ncbi:glycosyltransferase [Azospirillum himalayense]|uniref:Glycosyltransferase n=1 Tax=Azospirillum himalayense TaxID=654847 RepID=A0ABW0G2H0_9PROT
MALPQDAAFAENALPEIDGSPLRFVWLLRSDVRQGLSPSDPDARRLFIVWWALYGRAEYPQLGDPLPAEHRAWLTGADAGFPQDAGFPVTRLMVETWRWRPDLQERFPLDRREGRLAFVRWFILEGIVEHDLAGYLSDAQWAALTTPGGGIAAGFEPLDGLLLALWEAEPDLRRHFNVADAAERLRLHRWYEANAAALHAEGKLAHDRVRRARTPRAPTPTSLPAAAPREPFGVNLIGFAHGELGIGEDVRMMARACAAADIPFSVFDVPVRVSNHRSADRTLDGLVRRDLPHPVNVFCLTGFDTAGLLLEHGPALFQDRLNIGYWPWELPEWPEPWTAAFELVDELWSSSRYTQDTLALKAPVPVLHMPMAVEARLARSYRRSDFALPEDRFLFLYTFDWNSYPARKNPAAVVAAFQAAFPDPAAPVSLVLKTMGAADDAHWQALARMIEDDPRIGVVNTVLARDAVLGLCSVCDAVVSLHRSEGYGRTLAEAMLLGKPVVATAWSGNTDFCTPDTAAQVAVRFVSVKAGEYPYGEGMRWADPDHNAAVEAMRRVAGDAAYRSHIAEKGRRFMERWADPAHIGQRYRQRLQALQRIGAQRRSGRG